MGKFPCLPKTVLSVDALSYFENVKVFNFNYLYVTVQTEERKSKEHSLSEREKEGEKEGEDKKTGFGNKSTIKTMDFEY